MYVLAPLTIAFLYMVFSLVYLPSTATKVEQRALSSREVILPMFMTMSASIFVSTAAHQVLTGSSTIDVLMLVETVYLYTMIPMLAFTALMYLGVFIAKRTDDMKQWCIRLAES